MHKGFCINIEYFLAGFVYPWPSLPSFLICIVACMSCVPCRQRNPAARHVIFLSGMFVPPPPPPEKWKLGFPDRVTCVIRSDQFYMCSVNHVLVAQSPRCPCPSPKTVTYEFQRTYMNTYDLSWLPKTGHEEFVTCSV